MNKKILRTKQEKVDVTDFIKNQSYFKREKKNQIKDALLDSPAQKSYLITYGYNLLRLFKQ